MTQQVGCGRLLASLKFVFSFDQISQKETSNRSPSLSLSSLFIIYIYRERERGTKQCSRSFLCFLVFSHASCTCKYRQYAWTCSGKYDLAAFAKRNDINIQRRERGQQTKPSIVPMFPRFLTRVIRSTSLSSATRSYAYLNTSSSLFVTSFDQSCDFSRKFKNRNRHQNTQRDDAL